VNSPTITTLDQKINSFISSQDKHNDKVTAAIEKMATTISSLNTVHIEINHLSEKITSCEKVSESIKKDVKDVSEKVITNSIQTEEYKHIKKLFIAFIVATALGGGFVTKMTSDNYSKKDALLHQQAKAMSEIAAAIKSSAINSKSDSSNSSNSNKQ